VRSGVRIAVDVGSVRIGVAASDPDGVLASPLETLVRDDRTDTDLVRLADLVRTLEAVEVIVGLPRSLSGAEGTAATLAAAYASRLGQRVQVPVRLVDERLSTVSAARGLRERGVPARKQRSRIDSAAAAVLLQAALDEERSTGRPPGRLAEVTP
jgi:putative Holliday junction resolvase